MPMRLLPIGERDLHHSYTRRLNRAAISLVQSFAAEHPDEKCGQDHAFHKLSRTDMISSAAARKRSVEVKGLFAFL